MTYILLQWVPYEGWHDVCLGELDEIKDWLKNHLLVSRNDLALYSTDAPDIYNL